MSFSWLALLIIHGDEWPVGSGRLRRIRDERLIDVVKWTSQDKLTIAVRTREIEVNVRDLMREEKEVLAGVF